jgi:phosphohistidine phosphatase
MSHQKTLFILRHAKSTWDEIGKRDFDRTLKTRGIDDIKLLSKVISKEIKNLDLILSSPANRAIHTAILLAQTVGFPMEKIRIKEDLYETDEDQVELIVRSLHNDLNTVMIVGHNPTSTYFVNRFLMEAIDNIPTAGLVRLTFNIDSWQDIGKKHLESSSFDFPRKYQ